MADESDDDLARALVRAGTGRADDFSPGVVAWLVVGYVLVLFGGAIALRQLPATVAGNELSHAEALFESVNTLTLSGLASDRSMTTYSPLGRGILTVLMVAGWLVGATVTGAAVARIARMGFSDRQVLGGVVSLTGLATLLGMVGLIEPHRTVFEAVYMSFSSFAHGGRTFGAWPEVMDWRAQGVIAPLAVLGGMGIPVLMELGEWVLGRRARMSRYTQMVVVMTAGVYVCGTLAVAGAWLAQGTVMPWRELAARASLGTICASGGQSAWMELYRLPTAVTWVIAGVMLIGSAPSGGGSGLRVTGLATLGERVRRLWADEKTARCADASVGVAILWAGVLAVLVGGVSVGLMVTAPLLPPDRAIFNAIAAVTHSGPGIEMGTLSPVALMVVSAGMLVARMVPWLLIWMLVQRADQNDLAIP